MSHHPSIIEIYRHHHHDLMISILVILLFVFFVLVTRLGWELLLASPGSFLG